MRQHRPAQHDASAGIWLRSHADTLFAVVRTVVPDSLCAYDLGLELSALVVRTWDEFEGNRGGTRMAWAIRLADELIARAVALRVVPTLERQRRGDALMMTLSSSDLHDLSDLARAESDLDDDARAALDAMRRRAPSPAAIASLSPSHLVRAASSEMRQRS